MEELTINGKKAKVVMDLGVLRLFKKETGRDIMKLGEEEFADTDVIIGLLYAIASRGNPDITMADIDSLTMEDITKMDLAGKVQEKVKETKDGSEDASPLAPANY